ncbi:MAG: hypothetical protein LBV28_04620, partial [Puniceicoccales bacterium]|nr:hypothetical protein [Puniceicoccales bacterium]
MISFWRFFVVVSFFCAASFSANGAGTVASTGAVTTAELDAEYAETKRALVEAQHWDTARLARETATPEALHNVGESPSALVLRRVRALANDLAQAGVDVSAEQRKLAQLATAASASEAEDRARFNELAALRRALAFKNPLLDFDKILFLKHNRIVRGEYHMCD